MTDFARPFPLQFQGSALARWILAVFGWRVEFDGLPVSQGVLVVYPHTSNWDFIVMVLAKWSLGVQVQFWGKSTLFNIPLFGRWLRWVGGVPVGLIRLDYGQRRVVVRDFIKLSGDPATDFSRIAHAYTGIEGRIPGHASPIRLLDVSVPRADTIVKTK